jgi:SAM-dependent methyltransferase
MSIVKIITEVVPELASKHVYELSSRGPLFNYLQKNAGALTYSEYFDDLVAGEYRNNVQCQDVHHLTYEDCSFDICTSTEVFEHVPNDIKGFSEIFRVLKPGGIFLFTVPLSSGSTIERTKQHSIHNGKVEYLLTPVYHGDQISGYGRVLVFRDYGVDIVNRLEMSGFTKAEILTPSKRLPWGYKQPVIVAYK